MTKAGSIRNTIGITLGLSALWPLFRGDGIASLMTQGVFDTHQLRIAYLSYVLTALVASIVGAARWKDACPASVQRPQALFALSALASGAAMAFLAGGNHGGLPLFAAVGASGIYALWAAFILPAWGQLGCFAGDFGRWAPLTVASFVVSLIPSTLGIFCSEGVFHLLIAIAPLISALCLWATNRTAPPAPEQPSTSPVAFSIPGGALGRIGLLVALILLGSLMRGLLNSGSISSGPSTGSLYTHGTSAVMAIVFVAILVHHRNAADTYGLLFVALSITMLAGLFLVALRVAHGNPLEPLSRGVVIAGRSCMGLLLWIMLVTEAARRPQSAPLIFGLCYTCVEASASLLSYLLIPAVAQYLAVDLNGNLLTCSLATAFALVVITYAFLYSSRRATASPMAVAESAPRYDELAHKHGLTDRERDVMRLISQGNSVRKLAEELSLSVNTVQGYCKIVYRKMNVHSRQELIDLVREEKGR